MRDIKEMVIVEKMYHIRNTEIHKEMKQGEIIPCGKELNPFMAPYYKDDISFSSDHAHLIRLLGYYWHFARETTFEEVRKESFPSLPSRHKCLFATSKEGLRYWIEEFKHPKYQVAEIQVAGEVFKGDASFVNGQGLSLNTVKQKAERYWNGESLDNSKVEYLIAGEVRIVKLLNEKDIKQLLKLN
ncbi:hypothetical protein BK785_14400 [Bacillus thuringiensis serovar bolivia]|nr:hypothetical protein BK785_14400 [Bacillus thuringiensis serovar bolivia]OUA75544.1 hypothetical protein BK787_16625 [Bacillus thuringiensis serovar pahangi]